MTWCKTIQERENIVTAFPKCKSSCITPSSIATYYILCMYIKEDNIQFLAYGNKPTVSMLFSPFRCSTWHMHLTTLCYDMVVSRMAVHSVWGRLCTHSYSHTQSGVCLNSLGQVHPRSVAYQTTEWHQGWMCHVFLVVMLQHSSVRLEFFTPSWPCRASWLRKFLSVTAYHTFQIKGWCLDLICFINHGALRSCNESELILKKTKLYLGIACAGSVVNAAAVSTCWFSVPVCGGWTAFTFV